MSKRELRSVVLLSGGMDSATALYYAKKHTDIQCVLHLTYRQFGADLEWKSASRLADGLPIRRSSFVLPPDVGSAILEHASSADHRTDVPASFVPARNLIMISMAGAVAYSLDANIIIGGWNSTDVDYPDCTRPFMAIAREALCEALGLGYSDLLVHSPVQGMSKREVVEYGESLGVPWEMTRSCYGNTQQPCIAYAPEPNMVCDSCMKRVTAFIRAGVRDPTVPDDVWSGLVYEHSDKGDSI